MPHALFQTLVERLYQLAEQINAVNWWESKIAPLAWGPMGNLLPLAAAARLESYH